MTRRAHATSLNALWKRERLERERVLEAEGEFLAHYPVTGWAACNAVVYEGCDYGFNDRWYLEFDCAIRQRSRKRIGRLRVLLSDDTESLYEAKADARAWLRASGLAPSE
ncbi:MAG: hypothetical protein ACKVS8_02645 [Phycisphaerales bacterium]